MKLKFNLERIPGSHVNDNQLREEVVRFPLGKEDVITADNVRTILPWLLERANGMKLTPDEQASLKTVTAYFRHVATLEVIIVQLNNLLRIQEFRDGPMELGSDQKVDFIFRVNHLQELLVSDLEK